MWGCGRLLVSSSWGGGSFPSTDPQALGTATNRRVDLWRAVGRIHLPRSWLLNKCLRRENSGEATEADLGSKAFQNTLPQCSVMALGITPLLCHLWTLTDISSHASLSGLDLHWGAEEGVRLIAISEPPSESHLGQQLGTRSSSQSPASALAPR